MNTAVALTYREPNIIERALAYRPRWWLRRQSLKNSNLVAHAEFELRRAGLFDKSSDYEGMIGHAVMEMVRVFAAEGHSGMSAAITTSILERVLRYKTLTPITRDPEEWMDVTKHGGFKDGATMHQNSRQSSCFSEDGGQTYYDLDDPKREVKKAALPILTAMGNRS